MAGEGVERVLEEVKDNAERLSHHRNLRLRHVVTSLLAKVPEKAFLRGHRARAAAYLAQAFTPGRALVNPQAFFWGRGAGGARVRVLEGEVENTLVVAVVEEEAFDSSGKLPLHQRAWNIAERALGLLPYPDEVDYECKVNGDGEDQLVISDALEMLFRPAAVRAFLEESGRGIRPYRVAALVIGEDEGSGRLFIHTLPEPLAAFTATFMVEGGLNGGVLRDLMGFDLQPWEVRDRLEPGVRVRVQGDLVVELLEYCYNDECELKLLPPALNILREGNNQLIAWMQKLVYNFKGVRCSEVVNNPNIVFERLKKSVEVPEKPLKDLYMILSRYALTHIPLPPDVPLYLKLEDCKVKMKMVIPDAESFGPDLEYWDLTIYRGSMKPQKAPYDFYDEEKVSESMMKLLAWLSLKRLSQPSRFKALVNESHVVVGRGVAGASRIISTSDLLLPTAERRVAEADCRVRDARTPLEILHVAAKLASTTLYYGRTGDLYVYTVDGSLLFTHPEHGEALLKLDASAVVRITSLNTAPRPPERLIEGFSQALGE